jgi:hypothetical protein
MQKLTWHDLQFCLRRAPRVVLTTLKANPDKIFVAGGFIRSVIANEHINDVDMFVGSKEFGKQIADQLAEVAKRKVHETDNAYTVSVGGTVVQIIHRWTFDKPADCISSFDFTIAQAAFWFRAGSNEGDDRVFAANWESICCDRFYSDLAAKRLVYTAPDREEEAGGSFLRLLKFYSRGYRAPLDSVAGVIARMTSSVKWEQIDGEDRAAKVINGLLREVDPNTNTTDIAYLPAEPVDGVVTEEETEDAV